jgi:hypothetical protein
MGNHFHLLIEVPKRPDSPPNDAELIQRIGAIYSPVHVEKIRKQLTDASLLSIQKDALRQHFWAAQFSFCNFSGHQVVGGLEESMLR